MAKRNKRKSRRVVAPSPQRLSVGRVALPSLPSPILISPPKKRIVKATSFHSTNSRISSEAARLSQHLQRVAAMPSIAEKRKRVSKLSLAPVEPDDRKSSPKARETLKCKKRPDSKRATRGPGGSKRFVPWCG